MNQEIELKMALEANQLERLRRHPLVRTLAQKRARTETLVSTYFDTPEHSLRRKGIALRVRRIGERRIQTLKTRAEAGSASLQRRREFEAELQQDTPDLTLIEDEALRQSLIEQGLEQKLGPVFTTSISRRTIPLRFADSEMELALDTGEITAGEARLPISEAELELTSGKPTRIFELALALSERIPFMLERQTKAKRGYDLHEPDELKPVKSAAIALTPDMTAAEAFARMARSCLDQILANEPVVFDGRDPEGVHQMRVGVRRFRALIAAFKPMINPDSFDYLRSELRWLQQALGPAREWDVFADETLAQLEKRLSEAQGLALLREGAEAERTEAYTAARAALRHRRYTAFLLRSDLLLAEGTWSNTTGVSENGAGPLTIGALARDILERNDAKLRKLSRKHRKLKDAELHRVRILGKKMRYSVEFFRSLYPKRTIERHLALLKSIQDTLGSLNDAVVGRHLLDALDVRAAKIRMKAQARADLKLGAALLHGWQAANIERDLKQFGAIWPDYRKADRFWRAKG